MKKKNCFTRGFIQQGCKKQYAKDIVRTILKIIEPSERSWFFDLFAGGGSVGYTASVVFDRVVLNDIGWTYILHDAVVNKKKPNWRKIFLGVKDKTLFETMKKEFRKRNYTLENVILGIISAGPFTGVPFFSSDMFCEKNIENMNNVFNSFLKAFYYEFNIPVHNIEVTNKDARTFKGLKGVIYLDPPYPNTMQDYFTEKITWDDIMKIFDNNPRAHIFFSIRGKLPSSFSFLELVNEFKLRTWLKSPDQTHEQLYYRPPVEQKNNKQTIEKGV